KVLGSEDHRSGLPHVAGFAFGNRLSLCRDEGEVRRLRRRQRVQHKTRTIQISLLLLESLLRRVEFISQAGVLAPEHQSKEGEQHCSKRRDEAPPWPSHYHSAYPRRLGPDCLKQPLTRTLWRGRPHAGQRQHGHLRVDLFQLTPALRAIFQVLAKFRGIGGRQLVQSVERQIVCKLPMISHAASPFLSAARAARIRVLIVPSGSPVLAAISEWVSP